MIDAGLGEGWGTGWVGRVSGYSGGDWWPPMTVRRSCAFSSSIRPRRGRGLGGRLVDTCVSFAREQGYQRMVLWTNDPLVSARAIYMSRGFRLARRGAAPQLRRRHGRPELRAGSSPRTRPVIGTAVRDPSRAVVEGEPRRQRSSMTNTRTSLSASTTSLGTCASTTRSAGERSPSRRSRALTMCRAMSTSRPGSAASTPSGT